MNAKTLLQTFILCCQGGAIKRGEWVRKHNIFAECGENVRYQIRRIPLCPKLIKIGNNVNISSRASLVVHDATHLIYNCLPEKTKHLDEYANPIEIGDNVFIGVGVYIMGGVRVGSNVIIGAGAVVTKDLEDGGIYAGIPAKRIGNTEDFWKKRENMDCPSIKNNQNLTEEEIQACWEYYYQNKAKKIK
ncbi:MAG: acyltransferase [Clostridia bacterium]|nr:acyltransferase [Clostridia bacterium]